MSELPPGHIRSYEKLVGVITNIFLLIGGLGLFGLVAITVTAVFWRYILNNPIFGIEDISTLTLTVVVGAGVISAAWNHNHIGVNIIHWFFTRRVTRYSDLIARILFLIIAALSSWALFIKGSCGLRCALITNNLFINQAPFYYFLGASLLCLGAILLLDILIGLIFWNKEDPNSLGD